MDELANGTSRTYNRRIRKVGVDGIVTTVAGNGDDMHTITRFDAAWR